MNKLQWNSNQNKKTFHSRKCIWKGRLRNGGHFVQGDWLVSTADGFSPWISTTEERVDRMRSRERLHMMTSSNGNIFRVTAHLCGEFTGLRWIPAQRPVTRSFNFFFDLYLNERLSKHSWSWWSQAPSRPLWRHNNYSQYLKPLFPMTCADVEFFANGWDQ